MSTEDEYGEFNLKIWCSELKITETGCKKIETNNVTDLETLLLFREKDIDLLKLSAGDALRFRVGINRLHSMADSPPALSDEPTFPIKKQVADTTTKKFPQDTAKTYSLEEVQLLLAGRSAVTTGAMAQGVSNTSLSSQLGHATTSVNDVREMMRDLLCLDELPLNSRGEKALLPINFLSCIRGTQDKDEVLHSGKSMNLVLQSSTKRVTPEKLTVGQWIGANSRILDKLISSGRLNSAQLAEYLDYTRKIGDLLQIFTFSSVFTLDNAHRLEVHETSKKWNEIDATLQAAHLKKRDQEWSSTTKTSNSFVNHRSPLKHINSPCWAYNSIEGCRFTKEKCRFDHVDSSEKSGTKERAPRFQRQGSSTTPYTTQ